MMASLIFTVLFELICIILLLWMLYIVKQEKWSKKIRPIYGFIRDTVPDIYSNVMLERDRALVNNKKSKI